MEKNITEEQRIVELIDNCYRTVHHSLDDIQKAIGLLENSLVNGETLEILPENIEAVQDILGDLIQTFQGLDRSIQDTLVSPPLPQPSLTDKTNLKRLLSTRLTPNSLDKSA